jgi:DNA-binding PadR family transcriptional regulator
MPHRGKRRGNELIRRRGDGAGRRFETEIGSSSQGEGDDTRDERERFGGDHHSAEDHHRRSHHGGRHRRAKRGEARYVLLDALRDGPKHGYEIIKTLEQRSAGQYVSSPGTVYPTMQYLEELGLVRADQEGERRVYNLTRAGRAELNAHAEHVDAFWGRFAASTIAKTSRHEVGFLQDELDDLARTAWGGLREAIERDDQQTIRQVRQAVERCQNEIREIITERSSGKTRELPGGKK